MVGGKEYAEKLRVLKVKQRKVVMMQGVVPPLLLRIHE
jgi:hypothetical protein